jgi:hypothetical protein
LNDIGPYEKKPVFDSLGMNFYERTKALREASRIVKKVFVKNMKNRIKNKYNLHPAIAFLAGWLLSFTAFYNLAVFGPLSNVKNMFKKKKKVILT